MMTSTYLFNEGDAEPKPMFAWSAASGDSRQQSSSGGNRLSSLTHHLLSRYLDRTTLYPKARWLTFLICTTILILRIIWLQGFFVVCYAWAIYLLNLFIGFLSPQIDTESEEYVLPVRELEEYRPFQRRLPEFKFWLRGLGGTLLGITATFIPLFDLPVYWPILLVYFILLFIMTIKHQIKHMMKHRYVPFSWGKQTYGHITRQHKKPDNPPKKKVISFPSVKSASHRF